MTTEQRSMLRFDHREIAVIFSLFIFVSLLMFTVGILVGKGLAQAKYEGLLFDRAYNPSNNNDAGAGNDSDDDSTSRADVESAGTSVTTDTAGSPSNNPQTATGEKKAEAAGAAPANGNAAIEANANLAQPAAAQGQPAAASPANPVGASPAVTASTADTKNPAAAPETTVPLKLIPKSQRSDVAGETLREPVRSKEADELLNNPKLRALVEADSPPTATGKRAPAAIKAAPSTKAASPAASDGPPASFGKGAYTVQVDSYLSEKDAAERVEVLKKLGFPHAYFSAKQWNSTKEIWYRVWLGYYPDYTSANQSGRVLQERGEVVNYLVRKSDSTR